MRYDCNMTADDYKCVVTVIKPWYVPYSKMIFDIAKAGFFEQQNLVIERTHKNMLTLTLYYRKEYMNMESDPYIGEYDDGEEFK